MRDAAPPGLIVRIIGALDRRLRAAIAVATARSTSRRRLRGAPIRRVLVVCYGNIYRSPFVGEALRGELGSQLEIRTAGFHSVTGRPSPGRHVEMSHRRSVALDAHRSRVITAGDLEWADTIVFMDRHNWHALVTMGAERAKLVWLGALSDGKVEIADPYEMDEPAAERLLGRLQAATRAFADAIRTQRSRAG